MKIFAVRLNPDLRAGLPYSKYPTVKEYLEIHGVSPMNGFHEAVNFLSEGGLVRGYLPPRHLSSIRVAEPFILITVTAKTAKQNGDMIVGIQAGCKYCFGDNFRTGGTRDTKKLKLNYHYTCSASHSLLFDVPLNNARKLLIVNGKQWGRGPTYEVTYERISHIMKTAIVAGCVDKNDHKVKAVLNCITKGNTKITTEYEADSTFEDDVAKVIKLGNLPKVRGNLTPKLREIVTYQFDRDHRVAAYALLKANGICQDCNMRGPFIAKKTNMPFLEVHHVITLGDGGGDTIDNVIALCPNCHRKRHYGLEQ